MYKNGQKTLLMVLYCTVGTSFSLEPLPYNELKKKVHNEENE